MLQWIRNPDRTVTADEPRFWTLGGGSLHADVTVTASGYNSTNGWTASSAAGGAGKKFPRYVDDTTEFAFGMRVYFAGTPAAERILLGAIDGAGNLQVCVTATTSRTLKIYRGNMASALTGESAALSATTWYKLGFRGIVDQTNGEAEVRWGTTRAEFEDNVVRVNAADTAAESVAAWRGVYVGFSSERTQGHLYVIDGSGSLTGLAPGLFVRNVAPASAGVHAEWSAVGASSIREAIDDTDADDDTTYIEAPSTIGTRFAVTLSELSTTTGIYGVQLTNMAQNIAGSEISASLEGLVVVNGSDRIDSWQSVTQDEWRPIQSLWTANPVTGNPWTPTDINAADWGGRVQN